MMKEKDHRISPVITTEMLLDAFRQVVSNKENTEIEIGAISPETTLEELHLDSLEMAEVLILLEQKVSMELNPFGKMPLVKIKDFAMLAQEKKTG